MRDPRQRQSCPRRGCFAIILLRHAVLSDILFTSVDLILWINIPCGYSPHYFTKVAVVMDWAVAFCVAPPEGSVNGVDTRSKIAVRIDSSTAQYDACAKRILAHKSILSNVLARTIPEYQGMDPKDVAGLIEPEIHIGDILVDPGYTNKERVAGSGDRIIGLNTEDQEIAEGEVRYDLLCYTRLPDGLAQVIVNLELQKDQPTHYPIWNRVLYYLCRLISSQKSREFKGKEYGKIKRVYSIWICMNEDRCSIAHCHMTIDQVLGERRWPGDVDLIHGIMIGITNDLPEASTENELCRMLSAVYSKWIDRDTRRDILQQEYDIPMTADMSAEVNDMCNLGEGILEEGVRIGLEQGLEQGRKTHIIECVVNMFHKSRSLDEIADNLMLSEDDVRAILVEQGLLPA